MREHGKIDLLRALEVFVAAAETGSMTAAARQLKITQSAISQQLKLLEAEMRVTLMDRNTRPLRLTPAGQALRQHAIEMLLHADQTRAEVRQIAAGPMPHLRIAMFGTLARTLAPALVEAVAQGTLPIKTVSILRGMAHQHARDLPRREVDVVITSNPLIDVDGMERHELIYERFVLILPKDRIPNPASLREIAARLPLIRYSARTEVGRLIEQHLRRLRHDIPHGNAFDAPDDMFAMIGMGQGWAITAPTHIVHAVTPGFPIELRRLPKPGVSRSIVLVARKGELGCLPRQIASLCRRVLQNEYLPRVHALMPALADHLRIVEERDQADISV
ncbi:MAG TPA: LysR family transcriptional regulator [Xanthobacteraceae bacterium]|jgi:DNA-binding transcriptional LysR family regulator|nr:LysR family transcriptional regulator [Xanthobacteraceae bacterium]